jgi:hypothetical protein
MEIPNRPSMQSGLEDAFAVHVEIVAVEESIHGEGAA